MLSLALFHTAMLSGSVALPLYVTGVLDRPNRDVGLLFSACAVVEILAALGLMLLPAQLLLCGVLSAAAWALLNPRWRQGSWASRASG